MTLLSIIIACFLIMSISLVGVMFTGARLDSWIKNRMNYLVSFAAGVFIIVSIDLIFEAFEFAENKITVFVSIIFGFLVFHLFENLYPETHCHHGDNVCKVERSKAGSRKILYGDALHNMADGILLASVFVADVRLGFIAGFGILVHEFVQELSEFFVLKKSGYTTRRALELNFLSSSTILIGAVGGFYLSSFEYLVGPLVGLSAGAFIYILLVDLIPDSIKHSHKEKKYLEYLILVILGILLIVGIKTATTYQMEKLGLDGHGHVEEEEGEHEEEADLSD